MRARPSTRPSRRIDGIDLRLGDLARELAVLEHLNLPTALETPRAALVIRRAEPTDLFAIVSLLSDDAVSASRGDTASDEDEAVYRAALERIIGDPANELVVVVDQAETIVGTLQLTLIPGMARRGSTRLLVEAVRVANSVRSSGIGTALMEWVVEQAAYELDAPLVQLTSDAARSDAHRFYRRLGFVDSHVGFKYHVAPKA